MLGLGLEVDEQAGGVDDRGHEWRRCDRWVLPEAHLLRFRARARNRAGVEGYSRGYGSVFRV